MSESNLIPRMDSVVESLKQFGKDFRVLGEEYKAYRVCFFILLVHAGKIPFKAACKALDYERDEFAALCKQFNVVVNEEYDDGAECEEDEPPVGES
jgi:hypothetical protein